MTAISADDATFNVPAAVIDATVALLKEPGEVGFEGSAVWIGTVHDSIAATVTRPYRPEQVTYATPGGLAVEVTEAGLTALITSLSPGELVLARLHTHGTDDVDHSSVDDHNLLVAHPGAVSIVVPHFAAHGINLAECGVHILGDDHSWRRLTAIETERRFRIT